MRKLIFVSMVVVVMLLAWIIFAPAYAQDTAKEEKPTFYRLIPGVYVNGWPRFTIHYPKDWVERRLIFGQIFSAATPGPTPGVQLGVFPFSSPLPLDKFVDVVSWFRNIAKDVSVVSDKPSQLRDGTPAREVELQMVMNGEPYSWLGVATKKGERWINANLGSFKGKIGEDLKAIPYSLRYEPGKDEPVKVPADIQEFIDRWCNDIVSHDVAKVMTHYSDRFLDYGVKKGGVEQNWKLMIGPITSFKVGITDFEAAGDRVYLAGFWSINGTKGVLRGSSIIKESGEWKWFGNQRDVSP